VPSAAPPRRQQPRRPLIPWLERHLVATSARAPHTCEGLPPTLPPPN
jgi:hypothetical protein